MLSGSSERSFEAAKKAQRKNWRQIAMHLARNYAMLSGVDNALTASTSFDFTLSAFSHQ